ncbi:MAG: pyridoxamine 5'-phosphate oxidase family protein [Minwuia sp.]|uniref:pyridoxamine 5'-phosphate oxidase family protein n=1 Tax=Minwuia sp. TaxID=2493630 RepID=UPI003A86DD71
MTAKAPSERTRVKRAFVRATYERDAVYAILDAQPLCHVGYVKDGHPFVTPTFQWREGDRVYWHGSSASQALRAAKSARVCLTVSCLDGFVMARSGFHHSVNYRSAMILGEAEIVEDEAAKVKHLDTFIDGLFPGQSGLIRPMNTQEKKATTVLSMPIEEYSAKIRGEGPIDDEEDYALPIWAGVIPVHQTVGEPIPDPRNLPDVEMPDCIRDFRMAQAQQWDPAKD